MVSDPMLLPASWPERSARSNDAPCLMCQRPADGYRWFARVKVRPGRWEPTCSDCRNRSGVPWNWRASDAEYDPDGNRPARAIRPDEGVAG